MNWNTTALPQATTTTDNCNYRQIQLQTSTTSDKQWYCTAGNWTTVDFRQLDNWYCRQLPALLATADRESPKGPHYVWISHSLLVQTPVVHIGQNWLGIKYYCYYSFFIIFLRDWLVTEVTSGCTVHSRCHNQLYISCNQLTHLQKAVWRKIINPHISTTWDLS